MLSMLDRYILRSLLINYLVTLAVMISLYVVLDMFVNMDEFTEQGYPAAEVAANIVDYYVPNMFLFFAQLSGVITLFACMATVARLRRHNEMTAILASGVSLYRIAAPVVAFGIVSAALMVVDTELIIPRLAHRLARDHDDVDGKRAYEVLFLRDREDALLSAAQFNPRDRDLQNLLVLTRSRDTGSIVATLEADRASWEPPDNTRPYGRWILERGRLTTREFSDGDTIGPREGKTVSYPRFYESDLSPKAIQLRQAEGWIRFLSLRQLRELQAEAYAELDAIVHARHTRVATPVVSMILLLLGLPFFLDRLPGSVLGDAGKCMMVCGLCYVVTFVAQSVHSESASALPTWIPIFIFAPVSVVLIDRIRT